MDFTFAPEHVALRRMIREFVQNEVAPLAAELDREHRVPFETLEKMAQIGLLGVCFPQEYGGMGAGETGYCILMEELGRVCTSTAVNVGTHIGIGGTVIDLNGTHEQKKKYLTPLARGEKIGAFVLTEADAGSDAAAIRTRAVRDGDHWVINGTKTFNTNGSFAEIVTVMALTDPALGARGGVTAFIVEPDMPGFKVGTHENKMGIRGSSTAELIFEDVRVPHENVLGKVGEGFVAFMKTLDVGRVTLAAACLGGAQAALEWAVRWASARKQFGAEMVDTGRPFSQLAAMCKVYGSEVASRAIDKVVQIHGGLGLTRDFAIERAFRDARISEIFEGTSEIQRIVIASNIFREHGVRIHP